MPQTLTPRNIKRASEAGNDVPFEQAFSSLAHSYLTDKAPKLLDYEVGFQLIDRNEDDTRAVGIFAFKVGSQWLYAPVFFIDGDLKGHELLYLKNQDMFVPLKENWINYILNKKPIILGNGIDKGEASRQTLRPSLSQFTQSPSKYGSAMPPWALDAVGCLYKHATSNPLDGTVHLPELLKDGGLEMLDLLKMAADKFPDLQSQLDKFYAPEEFADAFAHIKQSVDRFPVRDKYTHDSLYDMFEEAKSRSPMKTAGCEYKVTGSAPPSPKVVRSESQSGNPKSLLDGLVKRGSVSIHRFNNFAQPSLLLTEEQREKLAAEGSLVVDDRDDDEISKVYEVREKETFETPTETGLYDVLVKPGSVEKCVVIIHPMSGNGRKRFATVIRAGSGASERNWLNIHASYLYTTKYYPKSEFEKWVEEQSDSSPESSDRSEYIAINATGSATLPFTVDRSLGTSDAGKSWEVNFDSYCSKEDPAFNLGRNYSGMPYDDHEGYDKYTDGERLHLSDKKGITFRSNKGDVTVPNDTKIIKVRHRKSWEEQYGKDCSPCMAGADTGESDPPPIRPGNLLDVQFEMMKQASQLKIWCDGCEAVINNQRMPAKQACFDLIVNHGLREATARELVKRADVAFNLHHRGLNLRIKYANPYGVEQTVTAPSIPPMDARFDGVMGGNMPTYGSQADMLPVDSMEPNHQASRDAYQLQGPEPGMMQYVQQAAQSGQREVFDTSVISTLLKSTRDDQLVDRHIGPIMKGMDRIGRLLLVFYWNPEKFQERYGENEMNELENAFSSTFDQTGELVLFLKQKAIQAVPDQRIDLSLSTEG
jgi:hypothetical protein